jgi:hypothetical protein
MYRIKNYKARAVDAEITIEITPSLLLSYNSQFTIACYEPLDIS